VIKMLLNISVQKHPEAVVELEEYGMPLQ